MSETITVESADGTPLAARVSGSGPAMVLVHGTTNDKDAWAFVEPILAERHRVWAFDRRGRGESGDGEDYSLEREADDVRVVLAATGDDRPHLVGHSFGAICSLEAASAGPDLASLTIYEPPLFGERVAASVRRTIELLHEGKPEDAALVFLPEVAGLASEELDMVRSMPDVWNRIVQVAEATFEREAGVVDAVSGRAERYAGVEAPILHVTGGLTDHAVYPTHDELVAAGIAAEHATIDGQRHLALVGAPDAFAEAVLSFTASHS